MHRHCTCVAFWAITLASFTLITALAFFCYHIQLPCSPTFKICSSGLYNLKTSAQGLASTSPTNLSHIIFALAGSTLTWNQRRAYVELWWRPNHTRGHVWLDEAPVGPWPDTCPPYRVSRNMSQYGYKESASRIAATVVEAYELVSSKPENGSVRWFVMGDDDSVFFVENLVGVLQKYDHNQMYYVGMPSESVEQDMLHGYGMGFGGGGFAISYPAAAELARVMDVCLSRYSYLYSSDERVQSCLSELGIPLTREPGFHQVDVREDVYGMLAAHPIAPLVSLHHPDYVKPINANKPNQLESFQFLFSAYRVDPARILQQAFCYDVESMLSVSVAWGYTVQVYPSVVAPRDLEIPLQTFKTWRTLSDGPFTFNTRSVGDPCARPLVFFLDQVLHNLTDATITQYTIYNTSSYPHPPDELELKCNSQGSSAVSLIERAKVAAPKMDPFLWKQAPRRHCCSTRRTELGRILEVQIKYCSPGEPIMPPIST